MASHLEARFDLALNCPTGTEYDEDVFWYFLAIEQARATRSNHPLRLLIATFEPADDTAWIPPARAAKLFKGLRRTLRETDVMGWYQQHRVAAAVLSERGTTRAADASARIEERVGEALRRHLPSGDARRLALRVVEVGARPTAEA